MSRHISLARSIAVIAFVTVALVAGGFTGSATATAPATSAATTAQVAAPHPASARVATTARAKLARCWKRQHRCYSAITLNLWTGHSFHKINGMRKNATVSTAWRKCRTHFKPGYCVKAGWVSNGYLAVYYREYQGQALEWASGARYSLTNARRVAARTLVGQGVKKLWTWAGTDHSRRYATRGRSFFGEYPF